MLWSLIRDLPLKEMVSLEVLLQDRQMEWWLTMYVVLFCCWSEVLLALYPVEWYYIITIMFWSQQGVRGASDVEKVAPSGIFFIYCLSLLRRVLYYAFNYLFLYPIKCPVCITKHHYRGKLIIFLLLDNFSQEMLVDQVGGSPPFLVDVTTVFMWRRIHPLNLMLNQFTMCSHPLQFI